MVEYAAPPRYPTPDYGAFGATIASLPGIARNAQMQDAALQDAQMQLNAQKALQSGNFQNPDGSINYAAILQAKMQAGGGYDPALGGAALTSQQLQPAPLSPLLGGAPGVGSGQPMSLPGGTPGSGWGKASADDKKTAIQTLKKIAENAGLNSTETRKFIATAMAESGLNPNAVGDEGSSFGLLQGHVGGLARGGNSAKGLGDEFMRDTGMSLAQFRTPEGQQAFDQWVANHWREVGKPNIFHAQKTPGFQKAMASLGAEGEQIASRETGTATDASPRVPPVSAAAGPTLPRGDESAPGAGFPPNVAQNLERIRDPARREAAAQAYAQRTGQPAQQFAASPAGAGPQQPIVPQTPLPRGFTDPQQAILAIDQEIARISSNPSRARATAGQVKALEDWRDRIAASSAPIEARPGQTLVDPKTGAVRYQAPYSNANSIALDRYLQENPNASAEQIQQFMQSGRGARSGIAMFMSRYLQEHPDASAEEVSKAAQDFHSQSAALTKFTSGPQGNAIRSFNVLVDHLGVLGNAVDALKNGNTRIFNQLGQYYAQQTGNPAPTNFDATKAIVGDELIKAIIGGGGALGDREEVKRAIDKANSPAQLRGVIEQYRKLAVGQLQGLKKQYESGTGREDFDSMLAPGTQEFFAGKSGEKKSTGLPQGWSVEVH